LFALAARDLKAEAEANREQVGKFFKEQGGGGGSAEPGAMKPSNTKHACVYERKGKLYIVPYARATSGLLVGSEPVTTADVSEGAKQIGEKILSALAAYHEGVPHPTDFKAVMVPLLAASGAKTSVGFAKGARYISISIDGDTVRLSPHEHQGKRGAFVNIKGADVTAASPSPVDVGEAFIVALAKATT
jgi:hypothetical protein